MDEEDGTLEEETALEEELSIKLEIASCWLWEEIASSEDILVSLLLAKELTGLLPDGALQAIRNVDDKSNRVLVDFFIFLPSRAT